MLNYLKEELKLNYLDLCKHLQDKYGVPSGNYFLTAACKTKNNKITRGNDGLFIHHIKENEEADLSKTDRATACPFEYQESQNLCYCNYLEHLILHMKIVQEYLDVAYVYENGCLEKFVGVGGICGHIIPEINDFYNGYEYSRDWQIKAFNLVDFESFEELKKMSYDVIIDTFNKARFSEHFITKFIPIIDIDVFLNNKGKMTTKDYLDEKETDKIIAEVLAEINGKKKKK